MSLRVSPKTIVVTAVNNAMEIAHIPMYKS